jgi:hypothetical protein
MNKVAAAAGVCAAIAPALATASLPASYAEKGDPARWYVPADTPREKYENAMREARNALADALRECRASGARARCQLQARSRYRDDVSHAKDHLAPRRQLA